MWFKFTLGSKSHSYAISWLDKLGTDSMAVEGIDGRRRGKRGGGEPVSKHY